MRGADIVVRCLERESVDVVFAYPGGASMEMHQALTRSKKIRTILPRHEQGGAFAAGGYARASGKCGVAIATSGPGATNLVTGVADAFEHAVLLELSDAGGSVDVRLTSIPGLVILKIIAIFDRPEVRVKKDTDDIQFIIANYLSAGNRSRLESGRDSDLLQTQSLDLDLVSARLLGRDMARMSSTTTRISLAEHLRHEATSSGNCPLAQELRNLLRGDFRRARAILSALLQGYVE